MPTRTAKPKSKINITTAMPVALELIHTLEPYCERISIAGSIRRKRPLVGDIELLCVPKTETRFNMFDDAISEDDLLTDHLRSMIETGELCMRGAFGPENKLLVHAASSVPVDIFSTSIEHWGMAMVVRTGSANFNIRLFSEFKKKGHRAHAYGRPASVTLNYRTSHESQFMCATEQEVFNLVGWPYTAPEARS